MYYYCRHKNLVSQANRFWVLCNILVSMYSRHLVTSGIALQGLLRWEFVFSSWCFSQLCGQEGYFVFWQCLLWGDTGCPVQCNEIWPFSAGNGWMWKNKKTKQLPQKKPKTTNQTKWQKTRFNMKPYNQTSIYYFINSKHILKNYIAVYISYDCSKS